MSVESSRQGGIQDVGAFARACIPLFSLNFLGLAAVRIWLQGSIYDRYLSTDSGFITVIANLTRVALIVIMLGIAASRHFRASGRQTLGVASVVSMTFASVLFLLELETGMTTLLWPACLLAGFGIIWGGGMWMRFYERLVPGEAFLYLFLSLAASCVAGFFLGLVPENVTHLIGILMPVTSFLAFRRAMRALDERESTPELEQELARLFGPSDSPSNRYDAEPRSTFVRLIAGVALFNLALGLARGFPHGDPIPLPVGFQFAHQFGVCALCLAMVWWVLVRRRGIRFSSLWVVSISFIVVGVLLLAFTNGDFMPTGAACISIANTFTLGVLWYGSYDLGRHLSAPSYAVLGVAWAAHLLSREAGRSVIWAVGPSDELTVGIMLAMVLLLAVSIGIVMSDSIPTVRPFFADLRGKSLAVADAVGCLAGERAEESALGQPADRRVEPLSPDGTGALPTAPSPAGRSERRPSGEPAPLRPLDALDASLERLRDRYFLTEREVEVARLLAQGRSKAAIAERLYLSENTVRTHARNLYSKLDVHSRQDLLDAIEEADAD